MKPYRCPQTRYSVVDCKTAILQAVSQPDLRFNIAGESGDISEAI